MSKLTDITTALADLNEDEALRLVREALQEKIAPGDVLKACQEGMNEVGTRFEAQDYFVSDLIMSGEIFKQVSAVLGPQLKAGGAKSTGKVVFGTVKGDIHDIGKDIVVFMLDSNGFDVYDLGIDVTPQAFVDKIVEVKPQLVALSGFLTLSYDSMKETVNAIQAAGLREQVKIMVGGGTVDQQVCAYAGADAFGSDAMAAVSLAKQWTGANGTGGLPGGPR